MKLTRRDAIAALIAGGTGAGIVGVTALDSDSRVPDHGGENASASDVETIVSIADVIYPSTVEGIPAFVEEYVAGVSRSDREGMAAAANVLDRDAIRHYRRSFAELTAARRTELLSGLGVDDADSDPEGGTAERVRYYLVNELLYALFASPKGSRLVGIDNPIGNPGGYGSYREAP